MVLTVNILDQIQQVRIWSYFLKLQLAKTLSYTANERTLPAAGQLHKNTSLKPSDTPKMLPKFSLNVLGAIIILNNSLSRSLIREKF